MSKADERKHAEISELIGLLKTHGAEIAREGRLWMSVREVTEQATKLRKALAARLASGP